MECQLPEEKKVQIHFIFLLFDNKGKQGISSREVGTVMRALGVNPTNAELEDLLNRYAQNQDPIEYPAFLNMIEAQMQKAETEEEIKEAFRVFDRESNGTMSHTELRNVLTNMGDRLTEDEADEIIRDADVDNDGLIQIDEFVKMLLTKYQLTDYSR